MPPHIPVLLEDILEHFRECKLKTFVDGTLGFGGHAKALLEEHPEIDKYIGFDQDANTLELAKGNLEEYEGRVDFVHANFSQIESYLEEEKIEKVDGFLFDLGVSSMQLDEQERGFSFQKEGPLDMRMDDTQDLTAEKVVNQYSEKKLSEILFELGEEPASRKIAKAIVEARKKRRIRTTLQLVEVIESVKKRRGRIHPATLVFQALRIYVNRELEVLKEALEIAIDRLDVCGRVGVISFHSLEDRIVKNAFRDKAKEKIVTIVTKKPIIADREEIKKNRRSRSAKLRFCEKEEA